MKARSLEIREPWMTIEIITPTITMVPSWNWSPSAAVSSSNRNILPLTASSLILKFLFQKSSLISFDDLKSRTKGYASLDYQFLEYRPDVLQKLEILVNGEPVMRSRPSSMKRMPYHKGQRLITKLKELIPRQLFDVAIQASAADA
jgi:GTP-binding protein LepA